jgi:hypothetical protein
MSDKQMQILMRHIRSLGVSASSVAEIDAQISAWCAEQPSRLRQQRMSVLSRAREYMENIENITKRSIVSDDTCGEYEYVPRHDLPVGRGT